MLAHPGVDLKSQLSRQRSFGMKTIRSSNLPFKSAPHGSWATSPVNRRYDRAAIKLAERTGMTLPVAQVFADLNGLGNRRGR